MITQILIFSLLISMFTIPFAWVWHWENGMTELFLKIIPVVALAENASLLAVERVTESLYLGSMAFTLSVLFCEFCFYAYSIRNA